MRSILSRKGQINTLIPGILSLVIGIIVLVMGLVIIQEIRDTDVVSQASSGSVENETLTTVTETGETVARSTAAGFNSLTVSVITNQSTGDLIPANNYSVATNGVITFNTGQGDGGGFNNSNWNVSYTYNFGDEAYTSGNASLVGLGDFSDFVPIIVIALAASVIIGLILFGFAFGRRQR